MATTPYTKRKVQLTEPDVLEFKLLSMKKRIIKALKAFVVVFISLLVLFLIVFKTTFFLSDIRPESMKGDYVLKNNGRSFLEYSQKNHKIDSWKERDSIRYLVKHQFNGGRVTFLVSPTGKSLIDYEFVSYPNGSHTSYYNSIISGLEFYIGKDNNGIFQVSDGKREYGGFSKEFFYLAVQHLIEFPFQMESANIVEHIGQQSWNGSKYELIFATWNNFEPNNEIDQYIIWINKETGLIDRFDATGRQILPFAKATALFFYELNGQEVKTPKIIKVYRNGTEGTLIMDLEISEGQ